MKLLFNTLLIFFICHNARATDIMVDDVKIEFTLANDNIECNAPLIGYLKLYAPEYAKLFGTSKEIKRNYNYPRDITFTIKRKDTNNVIEYTLPWLRSNTGYPNTPKYRVYDISESPLVIILFGKYFNDKFILLSEQPGEYLLTIEILFNAPRINDDNAPRQILKSQEIPFNVIADNSIKWIDNEVVRRLSPDKFNELLVFLTHSFGRIDMGLMLKNISIQPLIQNLEFLAQAKNNIGILAGNVLSKYYFENALAASRKFKNLTEFLHDPSSWTFRYIDKYIRLFDGVGYQRLNNEMRLILASYSIVNGKITAGKNYLQEIIDSGISDENTEIAEKYLKSLNEK